VDSAGFKDGSAKREARKNVGNTGITLALFSGKRGQVVGV